VRVVVTGGSTETEPDLRETPRETPSMPLMDGGDISRITLRIVEQIKGQAEQAAAAQGVSLNTFVSQAVQGALGKASGHHQQDHKHDKGTRTGSRLHGWVQG
jgi:hypothetical protein